MSDRLSAPVVVLAGGLSIERDVSLRSATRLAGALGDAGYDVEIVDAGPDVLDVLAGHEPHVVWPVLHGAAGEDGSLAELLRMAGLAVVGTAPAGSRLAWDKSAAAAVAARIGLDVPDAITLPVRTVTDMGPRRVMPDIWRFLGPDVVVKPNHGGSSFGLSVVTSPDDLPRAMMTAFGHDPVCRIERFVPGVEVSVTVLGAGLDAVALSPVEISPDGVGYDFSARYTVGAIEFHCPARLDAAVLDLVTTQSVAIHRSLGLGSLSRSDWIVDRTGRAWFLEVNTSPGMTDTSTTPLAMTASGRTLAAVCDELVSAAAASTVIGSRAAQALA